MGADEMIVELFVRGRAVSTAWADVELLGLMLIRSLQVITKLATKGVDLAIPFDETFLRLDQTNF